MELNIRPRHGPEHHIQSRLMDYLGDRGWLVERTHGNLYQRGFPDLYIANKQFGTRWIDVKQPKHYSLTKAQRAKWPLWESYGIGIWILTDASQSEYDKLFMPPNWREFWKSSYDNQLDIDRLLDEI